VIDNFTNINIIKYDVLYTLIINYVTNFSYNDNVTIILPKFYESIVPEDFEFDSYKYLNKLSIHNDIKIYEHYSSFRIKLHFCRIIFFFKRLFLHEKCNFIRNGLY